MADLTFTPDPDDPGGHVYIRGNPVPAPLRTDIKHLGGIYRKDLEAWYLPSLMGRKVWTDAQDKGYSVERADHAPQAPARRRLMECPTCHKPRWTTEPGCCQHCGSAAAMIPPPGSHREDSPPAPAVLCPSCGASTTPGPVHCPTEPEHRVSRNGNYCPQAGCGAALCRGLARWGLDAPPAPVVT